MTEKLQKKDWPIIIVSQQWDSMSDDGYRLRELVDFLEGEQHCSVIASRSYKDAAETVRSRADIGTIVVDWDIHDGDMTPEELVAYSRKRNKNVPIILLTDETGVENIPDETVALINDTIWKTDDRVDFLAGRVEEHVREYAASIYPPYFGHMVDWAERYKYVWCCPGHLGGEGFMKSAAGVAFHKFFGENIFRADICNAMPSFGTLSDHDQVTRTAEEYTARVFGADRSYYVLNGSTTTNEIIWRSRLISDDIALVDRNCHKSVTYGMIETEGTPVYLIPRRNGRGIIGPLRFDEFNAEVINRLKQNCPIVPDANKDNPVVMSVVTNSTYDGVCYNAKKLKKALHGLVENMQFDEAWFGHAKFHPLYKDFFALDDTPVEEGDVPIFVTQSTHKLLTAFSQCSFLHIRNGSNDIINESEFNEAYMMRTSTSPFYPMIANQDVLTKMMDDDGEVMLSDIIHEAMQLRHKMATMKRNAEEQGDWYFGMWQPRKVMYEGKEVNFEDVPMEYLETHQEPWVFTKDNPWHGFEDMEEDFAMLDPIKVTITTPGVEDDGSQGEMGIPADIVTKFLRHHNIVNEKTDYYSFLLLNSLGTNRGKSGSLLAALSKFKEAYDANRPLEEVLPELVEEHPEAYKGVGLRDHAQAMHEFIRDNSMLTMLDKAFEDIPRPVMKPSDAYHRVVKSQVEFKFWDEIADQVPAVMVVPYPPGIPICMPGEILDQQAQPILDYMLKRQEFEQQFPGYESDIHGVEREVKDGKVCFKTLCVKKEFLPEN